MSEYGLRRMEDASTSGSRAGNDEHGMLGDRGHRATRHTPPTTHTHATYLDACIVHAATWVQHAHTRMESIRSHHLVSWARVSPTLTYSHKSHTPSRGLITIPHPRPSHMPHSHLMRAWHMNLPGCSTCTHGWGFLRSHHFVSWAGVSPTLTHSHKAPTTHVAPSMHQP